MTDEDVERESCFLGSKAIYSLFFSVSTHHSTLFQMVVAGTRINITYFVLFLFLGWFRSQLKKLWLPKK
jgi:hypothetical protein